MSFSSRASIRTCSAPAPFFPKRSIREHVDERGFVTVVNELDCESLPDLACYDLDNLLRSGVPLQQTRTSIVSSALDEVLEDLENLPDPDAKEPVKEPIKEG